MSAHELAGRLGTLRSRLADAEIPMAAPETEEELIDLVREAREGGLKVLPIGNGTRLGGVHGCGADLLLSTRKLTGVVAYEPGDGTVTARAGTLMSELAEAISLGGHRLTPDVPRPAEATLGGVLADSWSGGDRLRFGPTRHHVLGLRVLSSDGVVTKTGGRLVKNVTGFELHRLYAGSGGGLCLILEASLRLFAAGSGALALRAAQRAPGRCDRPHPRSLWRGVVSHSDLGRSLRARRERTRPHRGASSRSALVRG